MSAGVLRPGIPPYFIGAVNHRANHPAEPHCVLRERWHGAQRPWSQTPPLTSTLPVYRRRGQYGYDLQSESVQKGSGPRQHLLDRLRKVS